MYEVGRDFLLAGYSRAGLDDGFLFFVICNDMTFATGRLRDGVWSFRHGPMA